ncbi:DNA internalization-related competence protein ComEC/Rec2 [Salipaludibacillus aurantiacus]|uniref:Competence protein ComEC n=1 Tax=Salipaludibacillus aurantiacus TaxID=1601833 RepID=A0A1H9RGP9_9BACI|nr:DNA internalization-related competence protein ComEC/Rec2 [Salipaludibacillus aurantiacus]SER71139.1 competence protein ComEC [Salipaludibacillus aurantiacus]
MKPRFYCIVYFAVSGLAFSLLGLNFWSITFIIFGFLPHLKYLTHRQTGWTLAIYFLTALLFFTYGCMYTSKIDTNLTGLETKFQGVIKSVPRLTSSELNWSFQVKLDTGEYIQVYLPDDMDSFAPSLYETCYFKGRLEQPSPRKNPYIFDYKKYIYEQKIHWLVKVPSSHFYCEEPKVQLLENLGSWRSRKIARMAQEDEKEIAALMTALVFGDRSFIDKEKIDFYRRFGILHLLAVSGLHVGLITFAAYYLLYRAGFTRETAGTIVLLLLPVYSVIAGGAPSVIRASLMCMLVILSFKMKVKISVLDIISAVCLALLIYNPLYLFHLGFQLSFLTTFSLLLSKSMFTGSSRVILLAKTSTIAQMISFPLTLYHFYEFPVLFLPMNLLFIPFISFWILPLSFLTVLFQPVSGRISDLLLSMGSASFHLIDRLTMYFSEISWTVAVLGQPSDSMLWLMIITVVISLLLFESQRISLRVMGGSLLAGIVFLQAFMPYFKEEGSVTMLDVGQGDAFVIELPYRKGVYLIDTGGILPWDNGQTLNRNESTGPGMYVIEPFLKAKGIKRIDKLILTHGHFDHIGETCYLTDKFTIGEAYYPKAQSIPEEAGNSLECLAEERIPLKFAEKGMGWTEGKDWFYILHPEGDEDKENDRSIVILASINNVTLLFTGDLEEEGENRLLRNFPNLKADILKVAHHGSLSSSQEEFLAQLSPQAGLISAGENNRYGHPHTEVTNLMDSKEILTFRTDKHGAVTVKLKGGNYTITPFLLEEQ